MKIYTKTGDAGETGLYGGARVPKDDPRVEAYGTVDELNAALGVAASEAPDELRTILNGLQTDLLVMGAELACLPEKTDKLGLALLDLNDAARLERIIDQVEETLAPLTNFILPGGTVTAARLHQARTICRRAERAVLASRRSTAVRSEIVVVLNRMSDLLFVLARRANAIDGIADIPWIPRS
jgi:cob(I)alamin adenosyltransferase